MLFIYLFFWQSLSVSIWTRDTVDAFTDMYGKQATSIDGVLAQWSKAPGCWQCSQTSACIRSPGWLSVKNADANSISGFPRWCSGKESACQCRRWVFDPWVRKIPGRRKWQSTQIFLPGKSHGRRSLAGYSPWGYTESGTTEWLSTHTIPYLQNQSQDVCLKLYCKKASYSDKTIINLLNKKKKKESIIDNVSVSGICILKTLVYNLDRIS